MTSRERIQAAFAHREPDRTPVFEYVLQSPVADAILGRPYAPCHWQEAVDREGWEGAVRQSAIDRLDVAAALGHDMMYVTPNPGPPAPQASAPPVPQVAKPDDPVEALRLRCRQREESWRAPSEASHRIYVELREAMRRRGPDLPILAPAWAHGVWTDTDLMMTMALAPEVAHRHFALATRDSLARVEAYVALGIEMIGVGGDFAGTRPLISPDAYRTFIVPEVRRVTRRIHEAGRLAVNASDGDLWSVIDDFLLGCEVDGYCEIDFHAGMDLGLLKDRFGDRITFLGNLDCGNVLSFGTPEAIRRHVRDCLRKGQGNGGHILCASNAITAGISLSNYLAVVSAYREHFELPMLNNAVNC